MNLAMLPLFAGFAPILVRRRGFPDWLARTVVIPDPQLSVAQARRATLRSARDDSREVPPVISAESEPGASAAGDGGDPPLETYRDGSPGGMLGRTEPPS